MSKRGMLFQRASTTKIQLSVLVEYKTDFIIIGSNATCSSHDINPHLALNTNHSLLGNSENCFFFLLLLYRKPHRYISEYVKCVHLVEYIEVHFRKCFRVVNNKS